MIATERHARIRPLHLVRFAAILATAALLAAGCGGGSSSQRTLTERERDSTLGRSAAPGGAAVTRALEESDRASGAAHALDGQVDSLAR